MPDGTDTGAATTTADTGADTGNGNGGGTTTRTFTQDDVNKIVAREKGQIQSQFADYGDLKAKASEYDKLAESQKTEAQKTAEKLSGAEKRATTAEGRLARYEAAAKAGLDIKHADRIKGSTPEEMEADAKALAEDLGSSQNVDFEGGARTTAPTGDMNAFIRSGARRNKV